MNLSRDTAKALVTLFQEIAEGAEEIRGAGIFELRRVFPPVLGRIAKAARRVATQLQTDMERP